MENYDLWLISDYPPEFQDIIFDKNNFEDYFSSEKTIRCSELQSARVKPDIYYFAVNKSGYPMSNCLLVDSNTPRAVESVRIGFSSIIYIDLQRFRRELVLREMLIKSPIDYQAKKL